MANNQPDPTSDKQQKEAAEHQAGQLSTGGRIPGHDDPDPNASGNPEATSTQENMGDGSGIRGEYGNASQTNGMEGGADAASDGSPTKEDQGAE
ncbi:hypothetical protein MTX78_16635 [Hymenobacter tibetensis]|uniref:Uncharacterized protein n=1 Tax=Hymenobacter tibetensis TaxID=497967 RepID=A0ABY4CXL8_9BACT|nr:hypothetical protein [Hymenobacter tibetensis]UOG73739.1 hypothetical protein MTX78_16635 [Hymenobacter tibetensis]